MAEPKASLQQKALRIRKRSKKKKPDFARPESWRYKKLKENWRKPRGLDNKVRRKIKGWPPSVSIGYKGPKSASGLHPSGYKEVIVHNANEILRINPKFEAARIAHTVGKKKRALIIAEAKNRKVFILNVKLVQELVEEESITTESEEEHKEKEQKLEKAEKTKKTRKKAKTQKETEK